MRILILGVSAIALSGCSWLGLGNNKAQNSYNQLANTGSYSYQKNAGSNGCSTGQCLARWNIEGGFGPSFNIGGSAITGDETNAGTGADINNISFREAYRPAYRGELGASYALSPNRKITTTGFYEQAESDGVLNLGTVNGEFVTGELSDYRAFGGEVGLRQYFAPRRGGRIIGNVRPYVEGRLGATRLRSVDLEGATIGGTAIGTDDIPFYRGSWVGSGAGLVGVETPIARRATLALESGVRYTQSPRTSTSVLGAGNVLGGINNGGGRVSIPLMLRGRYRF